MEKEKHEKLVRIGCSSAFWGDTAAAAFQLVGSGEIEYLICDYLAEVTMSILARSARGTPKGQAGEGGYVGEFVDVVWKPLLGQIVSRGIKVVTNAGGLNPLGLKAALEAAARAGGRAVRVAAVTGDDLRGEAALVSGAAAFSLEGQREPLLSTVGGDALMSCNAYLGASPIASALAQGAQVVVTGRVADSALALGPLVHEFGWRWDDWDRLSAGSLCGHVLECGAQATGGNFTDWARSAPGWADMGFPVAAVRASGEFDVWPCRAARGGFSHPLAVAEQIVYEIADPAAYALPDVVCDWRQVTVRPTPAGELPPLLISHGDDRGAPNPGKSKGHGGKGHGGKGPSLGKSKSSPAIGVRVSGARGRPRPRQLKLSATARDGYCLSASLLVPGYDARQKAERIGRAVLFRAGRLLELRGMEPFRETSATVLGAEALLGPHAVAAARNTREAVLVLSVRHDSAAGTAAFAREVAPAATAMAPGLHGVGVGRPRPQPMIRHVAALVDRRRLQPLLRVHVAQGEPSAPRPPKPEIAADDETAAEALTRPMGPEVLRSGKRPSLKDRPHDGRVPKGPQHGGALVRAALIDLCVARSGDKGDSANIGVIARDPAFLPFLKEALTPQVVHWYLGHLLADDAIVTRYDMPGLHAFNFVLTKALGGGGTYSIRVDRQGKSYAQLLLTLPLHVPSSWIKEKTRDNYYLAAKY